jgi:hypothetical protein
MLQMPDAQDDDLLNTLNARFERNMQRHAGMEWDMVRARLESRPEKLRILHAMESTGGEPDVIGCDEATGAYTFCDCSAESPKGRRSLCYDRDALESRKQHRPEDSALDVATAMGVTLLNEEHYRALQELGEFDVKTSSWIQTPPEIRRLGGALFCDRRYGRVFTFHNGADSYYASRGFRASLEV